MYRNFNGDPKWKPGKITKYLGSLSFLIQGDDGTNLRKHIDHIIKKERVHGTLKRKSLWYPRMILHHSRKLVERQRKL
uniref:Uncharacterized protein n=1 Tax=Amphimedon queenslandica TaxID=400682 RepID=A0A1X7UWF5_AMPQE